MALELLLLGLVIGAYPLAVPAFFVLLDSKNGARKGAGFCFGWLASLACVLAATVLLTGNHPPPPASPPSLAALAFKLAAGVALVAVAVRQERRRGRPRKPRKPPKWQSRVDDLSPWYAVGIAPLIQPWGLVGVGVADVVSADLTNAGTYLLLVGYCVLATWSYLATEIYAALRPSNTTALLARFRAWMAAHRDQVIIFGSLGLGLLLIGRSAYLLVS
jgi:Sap-like sulfolipid-1-addressing protein